MNDNNVRIFSGICGGLTEAFIMQPIDTIKVLKQSNQYKGINYLVKNKKIGSLYHGLSPFVLQMGVKYTLRFYTFQTFKNNTNFGTIISGALAGIVESTFITPFELLKTNAQTTNNNNLIQNIKYNINKNGFRSLYRGFYTTCFRQSINQASNFTVYYKIREKIIKENENPNLFKIMIAGMFSGSIGPLLNNPFDVIKTRYMNPLYDNKYNSIFDAGKQIIKHEGIPTLYKGIGLRIIRVGGGQGIVFSISEWLININNKYKNK